MTTKPLSDLTPNTEVLVRGKLSFSRLSSKYEGKDLEKENEKFKKMGRKPISRPFTTITIRDAQVLPANNTPNDEEIYIASKFYSGKIGQNCYTAISTGNSLPIVRTKTDKVDGQRVNLPKGTELARDLDVTIVVKIYLSQNGMGVGLQEVLVNGPVAFYKQSSALEARGITTSDTIDEELQARLFGNINQEPQVINPPSQEIPQQAYSSQPNPQFAQQQNYQQPQAYPQPNQMNAYGQTPSQHPSTGFQGSETAGIRIE